MQEITGKELRETIKRIKNFDEHQTDQFLLRKKCTDVFGETAASKIEEKLCAAYPRHHFDVHNLRRDIKRNVTKHGRNLRSIFVPRLRHGSNYVEVEDQSDIETDLDTSAVTDLDTSAVMDLDCSQVSTRSSQPFSKDDEIARLKQLLKESRAETVAVQAELESIKRLFKVIPKKTRGESGQCRVYSEIMEAVALESLSYGVEASQLYTVLKSVAAHTGIAEQAGYKCPEVSWFRQQRSKVDSLLEIQRGQFLANASKLMLSFDATSLHQDSVLALGIFDAASFDFLCVEMKKTDAKCGEDIAKEMHHMIVKLGLADKTMCIITDRCRSQEKANRLLIDLLNEQAGRNVFAVICHMHTVSFVY